MSTKFSIRPAPRKRPWICKRSPPCLIPPPFPQSLLATWYLKRIYPPPASPPWGATLLIKWDPIVGFYNGVYNNPPFNFQLDFIYNSLTAKGSGTAAWTDGSYPDTGAYPERDVTLPPNFAYFVSQVAALNYEYSARLTVTT